MFAVSGNSEAGGEERQVPEEREQRRHSRVDTENCDWREGTEDADDETDDVCHRSYGYGNGRFAKGGCHTFWDAAFDGSATPGRQHHEGVVDSDSLNKKMVF